MKKKEYNKDSTYDMKSICTERNNMRLTDAQWKDFIGPSRELLANERIHEMKKYIQHGNTSTFTHCMVVAYYSYLVSLRLPIELDSRSIIRGAILHDFYLYDWHTPDKSHKLHGFIHPGVALGNSKKYFQLNPIEADIIEKHMWPLTLTKPPKYREALLVCIVDKICSLGETLYLPTMPKDYRRLIRLLNLGRTVS
jgi:uncharacterized protein